VFLEGGQFCPQPAFDRLWPPKRRLRPRLAAFQTAEERLKKKMDTTSISDRVERKKLKRAARKKAAPKAKRAAGVARGSMKKKVKKMVQGQRKR